MLGTDRRGRGGDRNSSSTRETEGNTATSNGEEMASGQDSAAPPSVLRGTEEEGIGESTQGSTQRHSKGAAGARPKHGALARREYGLLAPERPAGDPSAAKPQGSGDEPEDITGTVDTNGMETGTEEWNRQHAPPVCGNPEEEEREPPD